MVESVFLIPVIFLLYVIHKILMYLGNKAGVLRQGEVVTDAKLMYRYSGCMFISEVMKQFKSIVSACGQRTCPDCQLENLRL